MQFSNALKRASFEPWWSFGLLNPPTVTVVLTLPGPDTSCVDFNAGEGGDKDALICSDKPWLMNDGDVVWKHASMRRAHVNRTGINGIA